MDCIVISCGNEHHLIAKPTTFEGFTAQVSRFFRFAPNSKVQFHMKYSQQSGATVEVAIDPSAYHFIKNGEQIFCLSDHHECHATDIEQPAPRPSDQQDMNVNTAPDLSACDDVEILPDPIPAFSRNPDYYNDAFPDPIPAPPPKPEYDDGVVFQNGVKAWPYSIQNSDGSQPFRTPRSNPPGGLNWGAGDVQGPKGPSNDVPRSPDAASFTPTPVDRNDGGYRQFDNGNWVRQQNGNWYDEWGRWVAGPDAWVTLPKSDEAQQQHWAFSPSPDRGYNPEEQPNSHDANTWNRLPADDSRDSPAWRAAPARTSRCSSHQSEEGRVKYCTSCGSYHGVTNRGTKVEVEVDLDRDNYGDCHHRTEW
ncbi:hypothetical protein B0T17DRAFT_265779 [Bombardia bombarda]|uniref:Uncharacterized protein n=1 Tax=Bombardia bombarda TaxID=252184 RepID=A0AA39X0W3_9PEZI|nr:hypothetical protein B0T17DRAFT_265779 [Bombardia bombarda]